MHRAHVPLVSVAVLALGLILALERPSDELAQTTGYAMLQRSTLLGSFQQAPAAATTAAPPAAPAKAAPAAAAPPPAPAVVLKKCAAEFLAMALFVIIGCGSAMSIAKEPGSAWVLQVSLTFGFAITVLAYAIGHYSGGQINCAVTFGLVLMGKVSVAQGFANLLAQLLGSVLGASILYYVYGRFSSEKLDKTGGLGTNAVGEHWSNGSVIVAEALGTFILMYVVLETAVNPANSANALMAPVAIGLSVFLAHSFLVPIDGCSINPTRSFGPALVNMRDDGGKAFSQLWIFTLGPLLGAAAAVGAYRLMGKV